MQLQSVCHHTLDFVSVPGFPSAILVFALTHSRRIVFQRLPWLIFFSLDHAVNWEAISAIGQIVGAIGVVVSLIYVATEVRNSARATQLASRRSISEIFTLLSRQLAEHPDNGNIKVPLTALAYQRGLQASNQNLGGYLIGTEL